MRTSIARIAPFLMLLGAASPFPASVAGAARVSVAAAAVTVDDEANALYDEIGLRDAVGRDAFVGAYSQARQSGMRLDVLAIADLSQPSTAKRLAVIDLQERKLVVHTWVAHGQGSGELMAERFSNRHGSHQTSLGLYRVGARIVSPKHGPALLLHGLDAGLNDQAREREIIIHGADYVSESFIATHGRLGRSWGCPAVPRDAIETVVAVLADRGLLYVHAG
jgi:hypothetical protein